MAPPDTRDVVGLANLGETGGPVSGIPSNGSNPTYTQIIADPNNHNSSTVFNNMVALGTCNPYRTLKKLCP
ncbi:MAG: hypothetical protein R2765_00535 [Ferruginibacter sp.]